VEEKVYFEIDIYTLKLEDESLYLFITALLNSSFLNYYINLCLRKRIHSSYPRIGIDEITKIPVPKIFDEDLLIEVNKTIKNIINKKLKFEQVEGKLNNLIFELYDLSYIEKQRIKDYFKKKAIVTNSELEIYKTALFDSLNVFFKNPIRIESYTSLLNITGIKINFAAESDESNPDIKKAVQFLINEIFKNNSDVNFLASQEKIFSKKCIYIIKKDLNQNWTETKALEDSQEILKRFMNGK
ncbi:MAG: hypothetical protein QG594_839, partial [Bacteroidota bacterium]|nr:hypothetical protein [Bacteroidota bacterium]